MFSPTKFPCTAWYITKALNVLQTTIEERHHQYVDWFVGQGYTLFDKEDIFPTREDAIDGAVVKLAEDEARVARAIDLHSRRKKMVAGLLKGGGV